LAGAWAILPGVEEVDAFPGLSVGIDIVRVEVRVFFWLRFRREFLPLFLELEPARAERILERGRCRG
jgi:hypothetical protein